MMLRKLQTNNNNNNNNTFQVIKPWKYVLFSKPFECDPAVCVYMYLYFNFGGV